MVEDTTFGHSGTVGPSHPILLVDPESSTLSHVFEQHFPELTFHVCSALDQAEPLLSTKPYRAWITSVRIAARKEFSLLRRNRSDYRHTPCLITVAASERALAYEALEQGALDCILKPINRDLAVPTLQGALWIYQYRVKIAQKKQELAVFRQRSAGLAFDTPDEVKLANLFARGVEGVEKTITASEITVAAVESSLRHLKRALNELEDTARGRALARLQLLPK